MPNTISPYVQNLINTCTCRADLSAIALVFNTSGNAVLNGGNIVPISEYDAECVRDLITSIAEGT